MSQAFALRMGIGGTGGLTMMEQNQMTAEDRGWWMRKLESVSREREKKQNASGGSGSVGAPHR